MVYEHRGQIFRSFSGRAPTSVVDTQVGVTTRVRAQCLPQLRQRRLYCIWACGKRMPPFGVACRRLSPRARCGRTGHVWQAKLLAFTKSPDVATISSCSFGTMPNGRRIYTNTAWTSRTPIWFMKTPERSPSSRREKERPGSRTLRGRGAQQGAYTHLRRARNGCATDLVPSRLNSGERGV